MEYCPLDDDASILSRPDDLSCACRAARHCRATVASLGSSGAASQLAIHDCAVARDFAFCLRRRDWQSPVFLPMTTRVISVVLSRFPPNQSMKPTAPLRGNFSVFATDPARGLSLSR
jgi:hypothetical protein